jgi:small subunit ribosomal protein SAe
MASYVHKRRADGIILINIGTTWEKLVVAAIENLQDIVVVSACSYDRCATLKLARYIGAEDIIGRFIHQLHHPFFP